ncbi:MAG TPA: ABC transporter permease, partial [Clostridia bacterium]|nr:ABC transporter permease [Clostridia bacterium]
MLRLYKFLKPYKVMIAFVLGLVFLQTLSDLYLPTLMSDIINKGIINKDVDYIYKTGGLMLLIAAGGVICSIIASYLSSKASVGLGRIIRNKIFNKVESFSLHEFDKLGNSTLITRTTNDITQIQMVTVIIMRMMIGAPMMMIGGIILALNKNAQLTLVLAVATPVLAGVIALVGAKGMPPFKLMQVKIDKINLVLRENLTGMRVIRAFNRDKHEIKRFEDANQDLTNNAIRVNKIMAFMMPSLMLIMSLTSLAIIWFGGLLIKDSKMDMGSLIAFVQYAIQIMFSMLMVAMMFIFVPRAQAAAVRINEVLDTETGIIDPAKVNNSGTGKGY